MDLVMRNYADFDLKVFTTCYTSSGAKKLCQPKHVSYLNLAILEFYEKEVHSW